MNSECKPRHCSDSECGRQIPSEGPAVSPPIADTAHEYQKLEETVHTGDALGRGEESQCGIVPEDATIRKFLNRTNRCGYD